jgi:hypothetical protein
MAAPISRSTTATGRALIRAYVDAPVKAALARVAFERGVPMSALIQEALMQYLAGTTHDSHGGPAR